MAGGDEYVVPERRRVGAMGELTKTQATPRMTGRIGSALRRGRALVPPSSAGRRLVVMSLINATGSGLWLTGSALFFTQVVGVTAARVGLGLSAAGVVGLLTTMPVGSLVDRFGPRRVAAALLLWRAAGFVAYAFTRGFAEFLVVACLLGAADRVMGPVMQSLVSSVVEPDERVQTMGYVTATRNAGFTLGGILASVMITVFGAGSYSLLVLGNAASFVLALPVLLTLRERQAAAPQRGLSLLRSALPRDRQLLQIAAVNGLLVAHFTLLTVTIPLWLVTRTSAPKTLLGVLLAINTIGASLFQVAVSKRTSTMPLAARKYRQAGVALLLCCAVVAATGLIGPAWASVLLVIAICLLTVAELTQSAAGWQVSFALAPAERRGSNLAAFSLGESAQTIVGPVLLTALVVAGGWVGWLAVGVLLFAAGATAHRLTESARCRLSPESAA
jgi:MFS family permease